MDSRLGPLGSSSPLPPELVVPRLGESGGTLIWAPVPSLGLFDLVGFVWGEEAGDDTLGGCLGCWCMLKKRWGQGRA